MPKNFFQILNVSQEATPEIIEAAYQELKLTIPKSLDNTVKQAYWVLINPTLRTYYLNLLQINTPSDDISIALYDYAKEQLLQGILEYQKSSPNEALIEACLLHSLPFLDQDIHAFLQNQEKKVIHNFLGYSDVPLPNGLPIVSSSAALTPWSVKDMNLYYDYRADNEEIQEVLTERRKIIISQNCITSLDDYQFIRSNKTDLKKIEQYGVSLNKIFSLGKLFALLSRYHESDFDLTHYCLTTFVRVLDVLRTQLKQYEEQQKCMQNEEKITIDPETIHRIDAINRVIAFYFLQQIINLKVIQNKTVLKKGLDDLGAQDEEIFPWLSIFFRKELLQCDEQEVDRLINEFLDFLNLKYEKPVYEKISNLFGISTKPVMVEFLKSERDRWNQLRTLPFEKRLKHIDHYLLNHHLSDYMILNICINLIEEAHKNSANDYFCHVLFKCFERVYRDEAYLEQASHYLSMFKSTLATNLNDLQKWQKRCPLVIVALFQNDLDQAKKYSLELGILVPSAPIFYSLVENTEVIIKAAASYDKTSLIRLFTSIFFNEHFSEHHQSFIQSDLAITLGLDEWDFPLLALEKQNLSNADAQALWERVLDRGQLTNTLFFSSCKNLSLFATIQNLQNEFFNKLNIQQHPKRYKELCIALSIYRTYCAKVIDFGSLSSLLGGPKLKFEESSNWAERWLLSILNFIAYPEDKDIDFNNILNFLELPLDPPNSICLDNQNYCQMVQAQALNRFFKISVSNYNYLEKLVHSIGTIYMQKELALTPQKIHQLHALPLGMLPAQCAAWLDLFNNQFLALPNYLPTLRRLKFEGLITTERYSHGIKNNLLQIINEDELIKEAGEDDLSGISNLLSSVYGTPKQRKDMENKPKYFVTQFYMAHCKQSLKCNRLDSKTYQAYLNYILCWENPFFEHFHDLAIQSEQLIKKYQKTKDQWFQLNPESINQKIQHWKTIDTKLTQSCINLMDTAILQSLISELNTTIIKNEFNKSWLKTDDYHMLLSQLHGKLKALVVWVWEQQKTSGSYHNIGTKLSINSEIKTDSRRVIDANPSPSNLFQKDTSSSPKETKQHDEPGQNYPETKHLGSL